MLESSHRSANEFQIKLEVDTAARSTLEVGWRRHDGSWRLLNSQRSTLEDHISAQPVLAWSAADVEVLVGAPGSRRRFLDRVAVATRPSTLAVLARYRQVLQAKRALLHSGSSWNRDALLSYQRVLEDEAEVLIERRARAVTGLSAALLQVLADFGRPNFEITVRYRSSPLRPDLEEKRSAHSATPAQEVTPGWSREEFARKLSAEEAGQRALVGPQRDQIDILFRGRPVSQSASAGERKAVGLLLLAAQARLLLGVGREPVLLIDDIDTELDQPMLETLWPLFEGGSQVLVSSNRNAVFESVRVDHRWQVEGGVPNGS